MFICDRCLEKYYDNMPSMAKSRGQCEICRNMKICNDIPSKALRKNAMERSKEFLASIGLERLK